MDPPQVPVTNGPDNVLTDQERADGWVLLFDGQSFAGWRGLGRDDVPSAHWVVEDGAIRKMASGDVETAPDGQPLEGGDIMTVEAYENFELRFDWKVAPGANSGIKYNVSEAMSTAEPPSYAALGFEYQVLDDDLHPDALVGPNRRAAGLYDVTAMFRQLETMGYSGYVNLEYEIDADDLLSGMQQSFAYMRGVLAGMG